MWACRNCQEQIEDDLEVCWNCQTPKDGYALEDYFNQNNSQNDGLSTFSDEALEQVDKPKPSVTEQAAILLVTIGIGTAIIPFAVKFLTGMESMSDAMAMIAILGVVILIIGAILAIVSKSKNSKESD